MNKNRENLFSARSLISSPDNWTTGLRKKENDRGGYAYCALGALDEIGVKSTCDAPLVRLLADAIRARGFNDSRTWVGTQGDDAWLVANYNNTHDHKAILAVFDDAIRACSSSTDISMLKRIAADVTAGRISEIVSG